MRLWMRTKTDIRKGTGKGGSEEVSALINWGSAGNSKRAAKIEVRWPKGSEFPTNIHVTIGEKENPLPNDIVTFEEYYPEEKQFEQQTEHVASQQ